MDVALVVDARTLDEPDCRRMLVPALATRGIAADLVAWDDPAMDWSRPRLAVLRATWDYHLRLPAFLAWAERTAARCRLWNPLDAVRWNARKTYLRDLAARGIATIPTIWLPRGASADLAALLRERGWARAVVKPVVSASAYQTLLVTAAAPGSPASLATGAAHLARLLAERDAMIQPYLEAVTTTGERSLIFIAGELTHTIRRAPALALPGDAPADAHDSGDAPHAGDDSALIPNDPAEEAFARATLQAAGFETLYARVDLIHDDAGTLRLMELELIEPGLWLSAAPWSAERFADAIARRLA